MNVFTDEAAMDLADMEYLQSLSPDQVCDTLFRWVAESDSRRSNLAIKVMVRHGKAATDLLLFHALAKGLSPQRRIRLLVAIEQVGIPLDADQWMLLVYERRRFKGAVLTQIAHLMVWNRQRVMEIQELRSSDSRVTSLTSASERSPETVPPAVTS